MRVEVIVPEEYFGDISGGLNSKRGRIEGMEDKHGMKVIRAKVPLSEMFGYTTELRSMTAGRGNSTMEFDSYAVVPPNVAEKIIEARK